MSVRNAISASRAKPAVNANAFEVFSWYFFRVSGVFLLFLVIIHLIFMHVANDVSATSYQFIVNRYQNPFWRVYDLLMLTLALLHGMNGMRVIVIDYIRGKGWRLAWMSFLGITTLAFWLMGTITIIAFNPNQSTYAAFFGALFHH